MHTWKMDLKLKKFCKKFKTACVVIYCAIPGLLIIDIYGTWGCQWYILAFHMGIIFKVIVKKTLLFYFQSGVDRFVEFFTQTTAQNQKFMVSDTFFSMKFSAFSICKWIIPDILSQLMTWFWIFSCMRIKMQVYIKF